MYNTQQEMLQKKLRKKMSFITVGITFDQLVTLKSNQVGAVHGHN